MRPAPTATQQLAWRLINVSPIRTKSIPSARSHAGDWRDSLMRLIDCANACIHAVKHRGHSARVGRSEPTRARRRFDASVDQTDARGAGAKKLVRVQPPLAKLGQNGGPTAPHCKPLHSMELASTKGANGCIKAAQNPHSPDCSHHEGQGLRRWAGPRREELRSNPSEFLSRLRWIEDAALVSSNLW
jgi:hypothetical protein